MDIGLSFEKIKNYISAFIDLSDAELEIFLEAFEYKTIPKKTFLLKAGEVCRSEVFIVKGCIRTYFIDKKGLETILTFGTENWWIGDIASFNDQTPSKMFIEAIEDCEVLEIQYESKIRLTQAIPKLEHMYLILIQKHLTAYQERLFGNIALSAEERYDIFLDKYPQLPQRISQHLIASYLGISPEFLSRIRNRKSKK